MAIKKSADDVKKLAAEVGTTEKIVMGVLDRLDARVKNSAGRMIKNWQSVTEPIENIKSKLRETSGTLAKLRFEKILNPKKAEEFAKKLEEIKTDFDNIKKVKGFEEKQDLILNLNKQLDGMGSALGSVKKNSKFKFDFGRFAKADTWKNLSSEISKTPGIMNTIGATAKTLGGSLGGITKILRGWPMAVLGVLKAFVDVTLAADQFVKNANKAFLQVRGPDIMTVDIQKQFKEFNNQIYDTGKNIRDGLNANDIREFMNATTQAGFNITKLNQGLTSYRDAVYVASKASKTLGIDLPYIGAQIGKLTVDFKMDIEKIDEAFVQTAFDAKKSGLSTDRFWTAIQNASASLSLYGVFLKGASKQMQQFTKTGVMGADETAKTVDDLSHTFTNMTNQQRASFIGLVRHSKGGAQALKDYATEAANAFKQQAKGVSIQLQTEKDKGAAANKQVLEDLENQLSALNVKTDMANKITQGNAVDQQAYLPVLADKTADLLSFIMKRAGGWSKMSGRQIMLAEQIAEITGINKDLILKLGNISKQTLEKMKINLPEMIESVQNGTESQNKNLQKLLKLDENQGGKVRKILDGIKEGSIDYVEGQAQIEKILPNLADVQTQIGEPQLETMEALKDRADESYRDIVKQTLSNKEIMEIAKNEVEWRGSSLDLFKNINDMVTGIFTAVTEAKPVELPSQKIANETLKKLLGTNYNQFTAIKKVAENITKLEGDIATGKAFLSAVKRGTAGITEQIEALTQVNADMDNREKNGETLSQYDKQLYQTNKNTVKLLREAKAKGEEGRNDMAEEQRKALDINKNSLMREDEIKKNLDSLNVINSELYEIQKANILGDPTKAADLFSRIKETSMPGGKLDFKVLKEQLDKFGLSLDEYAEMAKKAGSDISFIPSFRQTQLRAPQKRIFADGGIVTKPTRALIGEAGAEAVIPLSRSRTIPGLAGAPIGGAGAGAKNFNITFNAMGLTEKGLAQKVLNEVRGVLYKEHVNSRG